MIVNCPKQGVNTLSKLSLCSTIKPFSAATGARRFYTQEAKGFQLFSDAFLPLRPFTSAAFVKGKSVKSTHAAHGTAAALKTLKKKNLDHTPKVPVFITRGDALKEALTKNQNSERSIMCKDLGSVKRQYYRWEDQLPGVRPFFAMKCAPDAMILETLATSGAGFDCATAAEIELALATGVGPESLIFANPVKSCSDIAFARTKDVKKMTFDNADELYKVHSLFPEAELVLRLKPDDSGSLMKFSSKFGADESVAPELFQLAKDLGLKVIGVSFHIGSGCYTPEKYDDALSMCRRVFDAAVEVGMPPLTLLDIGGGFPGTAANSASNELPFERFTAVIRSSMEKYFSAEEFPELQRIGEPGRYFVQTAGVLFTKVSGKRAQKKTTDDGDKKVLYYLNDGVYGSFNCIMYDHYIPLPIPASEYLQRIQNTGLEDLPSVQLSVPSETFAVSSSSSPMLQSSHAFSTVTRSKTLGTFFGPTCDSMDKICQDFPIGELNVGDWVVFENMGAYTTAAATRFNGCPLAAVQYFHSLTSSESGY